jgi:WD40 repeat protein
MVPGAPIRHEGPVSSAQFSPDGSRIVTASYDNTAQVWDVATGKALGETMRHEHSVVSAQFSPDGSRIVTAIRDGRIVTESWDNTAQAWDAATGKALGEPMRHEGPVISAQFSPDGSRIVTASAANTAQVWDAATGKAIGEPLRHQGVVESAQFSPDGRRIATVSKGTAQVWDAVTGKALGEPLRRKGPLRHQGVHSAQFSPDGSQIVTASHDNTAQVWDAATGKALGEPLRHQRGVYSAQFSPDGSRIVTASYDNTAQVWDAATGKALGEPMRHEQFVKSAQFSPDGRRVVSTCQDHTAQVWDAATGKALGKPMRHEGLVQSAQFSPDGRGIVTTDTSNTARIWDSMTLESWGKVPNWVQAYAGAKVGLDFETERGFRMIPSEERLRLLRQPLPGDDVWSKLARWAAAPASERTLTPDSRFTCRQIAERERDSEPLSLEAIESALRYDPSVPLAHLLLAEVIQTKEARKPREKRDETKVMQAMHLRAYGLKLLPAADAGLWCRAAESLLRQKDYSKSRQAAERALAISPGMARAARVLEKLPKLAQKWRSTFFAWTTATDPIKAPDQWKILATDLGSVGIGLDTLDIDFVDKGPVDIFPELSHLAGIGAENFGMIATSNMKLGKGRWKITVDADDGVRVLMNSKVVIEEWSYPRREQSAAIWEQPIDGEVAVRVEYFENQGWAKLRFKIEKE